MRRGVVKKCFRFVYKKRAMAVVVKRCVQSPATGKIREYCYESIGQKNVNEYFRDKMREYRRRKKALKAPKVSVLSESDKELIRELHSSGWAQQKLAARFQCSRYRIENALGLR